MCQTGMGWLFKARAWSGLRGGANYWRLTVGALELELEVELELELVMVPSGVVS